jgi:CheY-like chemotaxis protein
MGPNDPDAAGAAAQERCRVLIADDDPDSAWSLSILLQLEGHQVFTVFSGIEALEVADREHPDVMIVNIGMPMVDGYEVARHIRQRSWGGRVKLIAATGYGSVQHVRQAKEAGFDHHLTKPMDFETLSRIVTYRSVPPPLAHDHSS